MGANPDKFLILAPKSSTEGDDCRKQEKQTKEQRRSQTFGEQKTKKRPPPTLSCCVFRRKIRPPAGNHARKVPITRSATVTQHDLPLGTSPISRWRPGSSPRLSCSRASLLGVSGCVAPAAVSSSSTWLSLKGGAPVGESKRAEGSASAGDWAGEDRGRRDTMEKGARGGGDGAGMGDLIHHMTRVGRGWRRRRRYRSACVDADADEDEANAGLGRLCRYSCGCRRVAT